MTTRSDFVEPATLRVLLVHGAWMGAWAWKNVQPVLQRLGIESEAIDLAGLGLRSGHSKGEIGLEDHVFDVVTHIDSDRNACCMIVGHSYGGLPSAISAALRPDRVGAVVIVDGAVAERGQSLVDQFPIPPQVFASLRRQGRHNVVAPPPATVIDAAGDLLCADRLVAMPWRTHTDPATASLSDLSCRKIFIGYAGSMAPPSVLRKAEAAGCEVEVLAGSHMALLSDPEPLAKRIAAIARRCR